MKNYLDLMERVATQGELREDRTGFGTRSLFGTHLQFDLRHGFPATTTKKLAFRQVCAELTCFLRAYDTLEQFHSVGCTIWDANFAAPWWQARLTEREKSQGYLGQIYGVLWRRWPLGKLGTDQLGEAVRTLQKDPWSRRAVVSAWNPDALACLPSCHYAFQLSLRADAEKGFRLDCSVTMRSVDWLLGAPFDIASYALLTHICAQDLMAEPGVVHFSFGDTHLYNNHVTQAAEQTGRRPLPLPTLELDPEASVDNFDPGMARLKNYLCHPPIKAEMNV